MLIGLAFIPRFSLWARPILGPSDGKLRALKSSITKYCMFQHVMHCLSPVLAQLESFAIISSSKPHVGRNLRPRDP